MEPNTKMISEHKPKRIVYFDILNIFAILAVIALHCNDVVHTYN